MTTQGTELGTTRPAAVGTKLRAGDPVRVRSREEIEATLDEVNELRGCSFTSEMWAYCGTTQRVLKPMEVFLDERNYQTKRCTGIVLLEGAICQGSAYPQGCDRCCFFFWREEWLETLEDLEITKEAFAELKAAKGDRAKAGWLKWDDV